MAILPLMVASPAMALPTYSGTVNLNFSTCGSTTMDWAVYAPTDTGSLSGSTTEYTYQYTLHGWSGFTGTGSFYSDIGMAAGSATSSGSATAGGTTASVSQTPSPYSDFYVGSAFFFDTHAGLDGGLDFTSPTATTTGWYTSALGPVKTWIAGNLTGVVTPGGGTPPTYTAGLGLDGQIIMGAGTTDITAIPLAPGVPEPATWALLIALMAFTTLWMRRRRDDEAPMEMAIRA